MDEWAMLMRTPHPADEDGAESLLPDIIIMQGTRTSLSARMKTATLITTERTEVMDETLRAKGGQRAKGKWEKWSKVTSQGQRVKT